jgi:predicted ATP-binding protein involved in virulence
MYIKKLIIDDVRHLKNLEINIGKEKKHLILTGKNGSGKTSILEFFDKAIRQITSREDMLQIAKSIPNNTLHFRGLSARMGGIDNFTEKFIYSFFRDNRQLEMDTSKGPTKDLSILNMYKKTEITKGLLQFMVNLKTSEAFAIIDKDNEKAKHFANNFSIIEKHFKKIFQDTNLVLKFDSDKFDFNFIQGEKKFSIRNLPAGYASTTMIVMNLILKSNIEILDTDRCGIVLIDEIETHLHISLQKKILPILTSIFPNIQFIVTTHSPFIITSLKNAVVYDLEDQILLDNLTSYSYKSIVEDYFDNNQYSEVIINKINRYEELDSKTSLLLEEKIEKNDILNYLENQLKSDELISKIKSIMIKNKGMVNK